MKKNKIFACLALGFSAILIGCTQSGDQKNTSENNDTLSVAPVVRHIDDSSGTYALNVNLPLQRMEDDALVAAINEWIGEQLGGTYADTLNFDYARQSGGSKGQVDTRFTAMVDFYFAEMTARHQEEFRQLTKANPEAASQGIRFNDSIVFKKYAEDKNWVTYVNKQDIYMGGAHGSYLFFGQTFRKSDGRRIGWDVFRNTADDDFQALLKAGLMEYWELKTDTELENHLMGTASVYYVPLPQCPPLFTKDGVCFVYNQYEIAAYAAGLPSFTISYDKLQPFMMTTVKRLVQEK